MSSVRFPAEQVEIWLKGWSAGPLLIARTDSFEADNDLVKLLLLDSWRLILDAFAEKV